MPNGRYGQQRPGAQGRPSQRPQGGGRGGGDGIIRYEIPRRAAPGYISAILGDHHTVQSRETWNDVPPGHRFQLYFHGMADRGEVDKPEDKGLRKRLDAAADQGDWGMLTRNGARPSGMWAPLKNGKRVALEAAAGMGKAASDALRALSQRAEALRGPDDWQRDAELIAPLATGLGNPHPVESGFAFLSPYGVPYLAGSGAKGVLRRAAEELALFDAESPWTIAHVWALFGFDEASGCFREGDGARRWRVAYANQVERMAEGGSGVLEEWAKAIRPQLSADDRRLTPIELMRRLPESQSLRRAIHWQGLLAVQDAFPHAGAQMEVDILNPHHKSYYEGKSTPHDAENPVPVFFLTVAPGARFTFRARPLPGHDALWNAIGDWKALLDAAFDHARDWLGFGAKTAVGYGAMAEPSIIDDGSAGTVLDGRLEAAAPAKPQAPAEQRWERARLKFNHANGTLEASDGKGHSAYALKPRGGELFASLPVDMQQRIRNGQPVHVALVVSGRELLRIDLAGPQ